MKNFLWLMGLGISALAVIALVVFLSRAFTTATVQIQTSRVSSTVVCAKIVTSDGAALSCWKESE